MKQNTNHHSERKMKFNSSLWFIDAILHGTNVAVVALPLTRPTAQTATADTAWPNKK